MTFTQAYNYLLSLSNLPKKEYMKDPRHCGLYLKRMQFFLDLLDNPEKKIPHYIHVAGTSGKGSVVLFLHSILNATGKKVGSTQSPHPTTIIERWKIGNKNMSKQEFVELVEYVKPKLDEYIRTTPYDMLSFFELTEIIGFLYFAKHKVDWVILETGCGGRYDSSNVIPYKDVAIITNVELDHVGIIGNNKKEIAYEKAGIIKKGCQTFTMDQDRKTLEILSKECRKHKATLHTLSPISYILSQQNPNNTKFTYQDKKFEIKTFGKHQIKNAILCIEIAKSLKIPDEAIKKGLKNTKQPLRMEVVSTDPLTILDSAHNPDKMNTTVKAIKEIGQNKDIHLIIGFSENKDIKKMISQLAILKPKTITCTRNTVNHFRKVANPQIIAKQFKKLSIKTKVKIFLDPNDALAWSKRQIKKTDSLILATGSIFLSGELRRYP